MADQIVITRRNSAKPKTSRRRWFSLWEILPAETLIFRDRHLL
jgi:hypothetical protein